MLYTLTIPLPAITDADVVSRRVGVRINGGSFAYTTIGIVEPSFSTAVDLVENDLVTVRLWHTDDAGLESPYREAQITLADTTPPAQPGEFTIILEPYVPPVTVAVLTQADFTLLGSHAVDRLIGYNFGGGGELNFGQGFTHRYVGGELRFLTYGFIGGALRLVEFACPVTIGDPVTAATAVWQNLAVPHQHHGLHWDGSQLWCADAIDYTQDPETRSLSIRTLAADDDVRRGPWGLQGINGRRVYGGACAVPQWFRDAHGVGPYAVGFGGYASILSNGPVSLGPTLYAIPDPLAYADGTEIPTADFATLMDHSAGSGPTDWYGSGTPSTFDRGVRNSDVTNEYDSGDWLSPAPDGLGRQVWGDTYANTGCWIDTPLKRGFVAVPTLASGRAWYENSTLNFERRSAEIQVFNPAHFGEVIAGSRQPWNVKPSSRWEITADLAGHMGGGNGFLVPGGVTGATFDPVGKRLYVYANAKAGDFHSTLFVYGVNC